MLDTAIPKLGKSKKPYPCGHLANQLIYLSYAVFFHTIDAPGKVGEHLMARVTVEDCLNHVENRFKLVLLATKRARQLAMTGADPVVDWDGDKATVVALREIAEGHTNLFEKEEARVKNREPSSEETPDQA